MSLKYLFTHTMVHLSAKKSIEITSVIGNALKYTELRTNESGNKDMFNGDENALSEDGKYKGVFAKEYEVFQIIFE